MIGQINSTAHVWSQWMFDMFWQVSLLILLVMLIEMVTCRRAWPHVRYVLWGLVFLKLLIPPTWQMPTGIVSLIQSTVSEHMPVQFENTPWYEESSSTTDINEPSQNQVAVSTTVEKATWPTILFLIWIAGVLFFVLLLAIQMSRLPKRSQKRYERDAPEWFDTVLGSISARLHLKKAPSVIFSRKAGSPAVYGLFRPVLVLPGGYFDNLNREQAEHVLLHELCHIKRGDLWVHWFFILLQVVYWYNPLLILARRQFGHVSEICCDLTVADVLREKTPDYRETLLSTSRMFLADASEPGIGLLGIFEEPFRIVIRLKWLEQKTWEHRKRKIAATMVTVLVMVGFVMPMAAHTIPEEKNKELLLQSHENKGLSAENMVGFGVEESNSEKGAIEMKATIEPTPTQEEAVIVNITKGGLVFLNGHEVSVESLGDKLLKVLEGREGQDVLLKGEKTVPYGVVARVMSEIKAVGIVKVEMITDPEADRIDSEAKIAFDLIDIDIINLIKMFSEMTGKNFIIDTNVKGKVTVVSPNKVSKEEAYRIFESAMEVSGYALVPSGEVIKVVPASPDTPGKVEGANRRIKLDRAQVDSALENLTELMTQITIKPYEEGGVKGLALNNIKAWSFYRRMGLRNGDVLVNVDDQPITSVDQVIALYNRLRLSDTFSIGLYRHGRDITTTYSIESEKVTGPVPASKAKPGKEERAAKPGEPERANRRIKLRRDQVDIALENPTELIGPVTIKHYSEGGVEGLALDNIDPNTFFRRMGLRNGDVLVDVDSQPITTVDQMEALYKTLKSSDTFNLVLNRDGRSIITTYRIE